MEELLSVILIRQLDETAAGTNQSYERAEAGVEAEIILKVFPPSVEYSIFIDPTKE
jgi:hypothetical protein